MSSEHLDAVRKFFQENYIQPLSFWAKYLGSRTKAEPQDEQVIIDAGYHWDDETQVYLGGRMAQQIVAFPNHQFVWLWGGIGKHLKNPEKLAIWVGGRGEKFLATFFQLSKEGEVNFSGTGQRSNPTAGNEPPNMDPTDKLIAQLKHQAGPEKKLPADVMIDVGQKAKAENNAKLLAFLKTVNPIMESKSNRSQLAELVRRIVQTILNEEDDIEEMTGTAAAGPVSTPFAFKKNKNIDEGDEADAASDMNADAEAAYFDKNYGTGSQPAKTETKYVVSYACAGLEQIAPSEHITKDEAITAARDFILNLNSPKSKAAGEKIQVTKDGFALKHPAGSTVAIAAITRKKGLREMTTTGDVAGYQIPGAFAKQGGSKKGLNVSKNLGFELTPQGEKEMERRADKLTESKSKDGDPICQHCNKKLSYAGQISCSYCGKPQHYTEYEPRQKSHIPKAPTGK